MHVLEWQLHVLILILIIMIMTGIMHHQEFNKRQMSGIGFMLKKMRSQSRQFHELNDISRGNCDKQ